MKSIPAGLQAKLDADEHTLAQCFLITRSDSAKLGFTTHDADLTIDGDLYEANLGHAPSAVDNASGLGVNDMDVMTFLSSGKITLADLRAGKYDGALLDIFIVDWSDVSLGKVYLAKGWTLGTVRIEGDRVTAEVRSRTQLLAANTLRVMGPHCDADHGDARCGVNLAAYTVTGSVTGATDRRRFQDSARTEVDNKFNYAKLTWTSGNNNGRVMEVKDWTLSTRTFELFEAMPEEIQVGDGYSVHYGCDKSYDTCEQEYANGVNYRGWLFIPGFNNVTRYPGTTNG